MTPPPAPRVPAVPSVSLPPMPPGMSGMGQPVVPTLGTSRSELLLTALAAGPLAATGALLPAAPPGAVVPASPAKKRRKLPKNRPAQTPLADTPSLTELLVKSDATLSEPFGEEPGEGETEQLRHRFVRLLREFLATRGTHMKRPPQLGYKDLDFYNLFSEVVNHGGFQSVVNKVGTWAKIWPHLRNYDPGITDSSFRLKKNYERFLVEFEHRYVGCGTAEDLAVLRSLAIDPPEAALQVAIEAAQEVKAHGFSSSSKKKKVAMGLTVASGSSASSAASVSSAAPTTGSSSKKKRKADAGPAAPSSSKAAPPLSNSTGYGAKGSGTAMSSSSSWSNDDDLNMHDPENAAAVAALWNKLSAPTIASSPNSSSVEHSQSTSEEEHASSAIRIPQPVRPGASDKVPSAASSASTSASSSASTAPTSSTPATAAAPASLGNSTSSPLSMSRSSAAPFPPRLAPMVGPDGATTSRSSPFSRPGPPRSLSSSDLARTVAELTSLQNRPANVLMVDADGKRVPLPSPSPALSYEPASYSSTVLASDGNAYLDESAEIIRMSGDLVPAPVVGFLEPKDRETIAPSPAPTPPRPPPEARTKSAKAGKRA